MARNREASKFGWLFKECTYRPQVELLTYVCRLPAGGRWIRTIGTASDQFVRLFAGGGWIRNFSSALPLVVSRVSEIRDPRRAAGRIGVRFASLQEGTDSNFG
jgi:hypothetical protein